MAKIVDKAKSVVYASVGVNILIVDAIAGRKIGTPDSVNDHVTLAREQATSALTKFRAVGEPRAAKLTEKLPDKVASAISNGCTKAWNRLGIKGPEPSDSTNESADPEPTDSTNKSADPEPTE